MGGQLSERINRYTLILKHAEIRDGDGELLISGAYPAGFILPGQSQAAQVADSQEHVGARRDVLQRFEQYENSTGLPDRLMGDLGISLN